MFRKESRSFLKQNVAAARFRESLLCVAKRKKYRKMKALAVSGVAAGNEGVECGPELFQIIVAFLENLVARAIDGDARA